MDKFTRAFFECALWSSSDSEDRSLDENYSVEDIDSHCVMKLIAECAEFQQTNAASLAECGDDFQNGHDFWLTRNRHGAGFWDRGYGAVGEHLTEASHVYGKVDLYVGNDGRIYASGYEK